MKAQFCSQSARRLLTLSLLIGCAAKASAVKTGDTRAQVIKELGDPSGTAPLGPDRILLSYERGTVVLYQGRVVTASLSSDEDYRRAKEKEAAEKLRLQYKREAEARAIALKEEEARAAEQKALEDARREAEERQIAEQSKQEARKAAERRRNRPELSTGTDFKATNEDSKNEVSVSAVKISVVRGPTPAPYESIEMGNDGGGHWSQYRTIVHPPPPCPTELKLILKVRNGTTSSLSGINLVYKLKINGAEGDAVTVTENREKIILPDSSGEVEISIRVNGKDDWLRLQDVESVSFRFYKGEKPLEVGNCSWVRSNSK